MTPEEFKTLQEQAKAGDVAAMLDLAFAYYTGIGIDQNKQLSFEWIKKAAEAGGANAMYPLALAYRDGEGTGKNPQLFFEWIKKAAEAGVADAMLLLALAYFNGEGTEKNPQLFFEWTKRAVEKGHARAMYNLAVAYKFGEGTNPDPAQFTHWLNQAIQLDSLAAIVLDRIQDLPLTHLINVHPALMELSDAVAEIKSSHLLRLDDKPGEVAHFTLYTTLEKMLPVQDGSKTEKPNNHFRLYNIEYLNDPDEGRALFQHLDKRYPELCESLFDGWEKDSKMRYYDEKVSVYTCSFSTETDRLDLWRAYGNDGDGISIVTPSNAFDSADSANSAHLVAKAHAQTIKPSKNGDDAQDDTEKNPAEPDVPLVLYQIRYHKKEFDNAIENLHPFLEKISAYKAKLDKENIQFAPVRESVLLLLSAIQFLYKNAEYENEKEVRLIYAASIHSKRLHMDERSPGRLFVKTRDIAFQSAGSRVVIGPKVAEKAATELNCKFRLACHKLLENVTVEQSKIHYR